MIGKTLSQYRIISKFGEGGMELVYRDQDGRLDRDAAINVLATVVAQDLSRDIHSEGL